MRTEGANVTSDSGMHPVLLLTAGRAVAFGATFAIPLALARILDQAEFGTYKQLFLVAATLASIAQFGMAEGLFYFLPLTDRRGGRYAFNALLALTAGGLACFGLLVLMGGRLARWFDNEALLRLGGLLGAYLLLLLPSLVLEITLTARKRYSHAAVAYASTDVLRAIALIVPVVVFRTLESLLIGAAIFALARLCITLVYFRREFGGVVRLDGGALREQLAYALPFQLGVVLSILATNFHYYMVASSADAVTYAIYAVGCLQIPLVEMVSTSAGNVMMIRMRESIASGRADAVLAVWRETTRKLALIFFPLAALLLVTADALIPVLFTDRYIRSVPIFMVTSAAIVFSVLQTDGVLRVYARTRIVAVVSAIQFASIALLIWPLMSRFGLIGVALATWLGSGVGKTIALVHAGRLLNAGVAELIPWRSLGEILAAAAISALVVRAVTVQVPLTLLPLLIVTTGVYAALYGALVQLRGLWGPKVRRAVTSSVGSLPAGR